MSLHNSEYHAMSDLRRASKEAVKKVVESSEVYQRIKGYIKLANDNSNLVAEQIRNNNSLCYDGITRIHITFNEESLITSAYEIHISTYKAKDFHRGVDVGIDSFITLLSECSLINDII